MGHFTRREMDKDIASDALLEFYAKHGTDSDKENFIYYNFLLIN